MTKTTFNRNIFTLRLVSFVTYLTISTLQQNTIPDIDFTQVIEIESIENPFFLSFIQEEQKYGKTLVKHFYIPIATIFDISKTVNNTLSCLQPVNVGPCVLFAMSYSNESPNPETTTIDDSLNFDPYKYFNIDYQPRTIYSAFIQIMLEMDLYMVSAFQLDFELQDYKFILKPIEGVYNRTFPLHSEYISGINFEGILMSNKLLEIIKKDPDKNIYYTPEIKFDIKDNEKNDKGIPDMVQINSYQKAYLIGSVLYSYFESKKRKERRIYHNLLLQRILLTYKQLKVKIDIGFPKDIIIKELDLFDRKNEFYIPDEIIEIDWLFVPFRCFEHIHNILVTRNEEFLKGKWFYTPEVKRKDNKLDLIDNKEQHMVPIHGKFLNRAIEEESKYIKGNMNIDETFKINIAYKNGPCGLIDSDTKIGPALKEFIPAYNGTVKTYSKIRDLQNINEVFFSDWEKYKYLTSKHCKNPEENEDCCVKCIEDNNIKCSEEINKK